MAPTKSGNSSRKSASNRPRYYRKSKPVKQQELQQPSTAELPKQNQHVQVHRAGVLNAKAQLPTITNLEDYLTFFKEVGLEAQRNPGKVSYRKAALASEEKYDIFLEKALKLTPGSITQLTEGKVDVGGKRKERKAKEQEILELSRVISYKRSVASGFFTGEVRCWLVPEIMIREDYNLSMLPEAIASKMNDGRSWRGEGKGFPGELCIFGNRRVAVRVLGLEVGSSAKVANVIVISCFAVTDHSKYQSFLSLLRSRPDILRTALLECKEFYNENIEAQHVNNKENPFIYRSIREDTNRGELEVEDSYQHGGG